MDAITYVLAAAGLLVGAALGYLAGSGRASAVTATLGAEREAATERLAEQRDRLAAADRDWADRLERERAQAAEALERAERGYEARLSDERRTGREAAERVRSDAEERLAEVKSDHKRLADEFAALSRRALAANAEEFLRQADERLKRTQVEGAAELAKREQAVRQLVEPLTRTLTDVKTEMTATEKSRLEAHTALTEQVRAMHASSDALRTETNQLVTALRAPQVRGAWGELQLRRTVEAAGMVDHVDFDEQVQLDGGALRPDLVVHLPGEKQVVVDSKVAFGGYLEAMEARDDATKSTRLAAHARHMRSHIDQLSGKEYWSHLEASPEFTVMFVPSEVFLSAALEQDPTLQEHAFRKSIVMATPATLVALLRTVAYTWRQESLATEARQVFTVGRELHKRLATFGQHLDTLARRLNSTVDTFNTMTASLDSRVVPQARKLSALQGLETGLGVPPPLEVLAVPAQKPDLYDAPAELGPPADRTSGRRDAAPGEALDAASTG